MKDVLKELRAERGMSVSDLANAFRKAESTVRMWESGNANPDIPTLSALADYFDVPIDYLLGRSSMRIPDKDIQGAAKLIGLSETAVSTLCILKNQGDNRVLNLLNLLIEHEAPPPMQDNNESDFDFGLKMSDWKDTHTSVLSNIANCVFYSHDADLEQALCDFKDILAKKMSQSNRMTCQGDSYIEGFLQKELMNIAIEKIKTFVELERNGGSSK